MRPNELGRSWSPKLDSDSPHFRRLWARHDVIAWDDAPLTLHHPYAGLLQLHLERFDIPGGAGQASSSATPPTPTLQLPSNDWLTSDWHTFAEWRSLGQNACLSRRPGREWNTWPNVVAWSRRPLYPGDCSHLYLLLDWCSPRTPYRRCCWLVSSSFPPTTRSSVVATRAMSPLSASRSS